MAGPLSNGFVLLHRKIVSWPLWPDPRCVQLLVFLLANAQWKGTRVFYRGHYLDLTPGQLAITRGDLAQAIHATYKQARRALELLEKEGTLRVQNRANRFLLLSLVNYDTYQWPDEAAGQTEGKPEGKPRANRGQTEGKQNEPCNQENHVTNQEETLPSEEVSSSRARPKRPRTTRWDPPDMELATWIRDRIRQEIVPDLREPNLGQWANDIRLMREQDRRTPEDIQALFAWVQQDSFWRANVLCPATLRKRYDQLKAKMQSNGRHGNWVTD